MSARYVIERWPHGWLICAPVGRTGIPMTALAECGALFPEGAVMAKGIPHHFHATGRHEVAFCVGTDAEIGVWRTEIKNAIATLPPEERWWKGIDVGLSSAAIFSVFAIHFGHEARVMAGGAVPRDADDFGRCTRLLALFPHWRPELHRVAIAYPDTKWPELIARWAEIEAVHPNLQSEILRSL